MSAVQQVQSGAFLEELSLNSDWGENGGAREFILDIK